MARLWGFFGLSFPCSGVVLFVYVVGFSLCFIWLVVGFSLVFLFCFENLIDTVEGSLRWWGLPDAMDTLSTILAGGIWLVFVS